MNLFKIKYYVSENLIVTFILYKFKKELNKFKKELKCYFIKLL